MSRQSPFGFMFSTVIEIAAIVAIVSFLPRIDLRSIGGSGTNLMTTGNRIDASEPVVSLADWHAGRSAPPLSPTAPAAFYTGAPTPAAQPANALAQVGEPPVKVNVEERLDRASQQLVNSVGSYVSEAATNLLTPPPANNTPATSFYAPPVATPPATTTSAPTWPQYTAPERAATRQPTNGPTTPQPRAWMRY